VSKITFPETKLYEDFRRTEKVLARDAEPRMDTYRPLCVLSHDLVNKLSAIIGHCDLLSKEAEVDSECARRLLLIRQIANSMAEQINQHQCDLEDRIRTAAIQELPVKTARR
jgi:hypothetical protein